MMIATNKNSAEKIYRDLLREKIPSFSGNDILDDWIEDLISYDTSLAGLLARIASGEKLQNSKVPDISPLKEQFLNLETEDFDFEKIEECRSYLFLLLRAFDFLCNNIRGSR